MNESNIEDVYDTTVYKEAEATILLDEFNMSLTWYTDGVSLLNCSSYSLWPFVFVINELPPELPLEENLIIGGLWGDYEKPHPNLFLLPIYKEVEKLKKGFSVNLCNQEEIAVTAVILFGNGDIPAKSLFMNMKGHGGYFSCPKCLIQGEMSQRTGMVMVFPHDGPLVLRNDESYHDSVKKRVLSKKEHNGIHGPTVLSYITYSRFVKSVVIDSMHCTSLGIV